MIRCEKVLIHDHAVSAAALVAAQGSVHSWEVIAQFEVVEKD